ncbi:MAG: peptidoglycan DD-metalloendopeptidase family protein [Lachnospiraceae bacterium]|nr:peptidoglycan DD-metalloendopeptidase family protein [Lachnospiraceae bacterium]
MSGVFLKILNISITAGWLILAVILIRLLFKKAPKWLTCLLWGLVALRLLIPFSIESALSLIPSGEVVSESITTNYSPSIDTGFVIVNNTVNPIINHTLAPKPEMKTNPMEIIVSAASIIWIAGMVAMLVYATASYFLLKKKVSTAIPLIGRFDPKRRVLLCDGIKSPFILGIIRPAIYIPSNLDEETMEYVYAHENSHIKRHDNLWKPFGFILLCVYWFNPLCWVAYILLCKDIEAACDEKVIKDKEKEYLALYSQALLNCAVPRRMISACPVAFGETGVKSRVKGILNYRKPAFWIILVSLIAIIVVAVCFLTNPKKKELKQPPELYVAFEGSDEKTLADDCGFIPAEEIPYVIFHEIVSDRKGIKGDFESHNVACVYANNNEDVVRLLFSEEPDRVEIDCFSETGKETGNGSEEFFVPLYNEKTHIIPVPTDDSYMFTVKATWDGIGMGLFDFAVIRPGEETTDNKVAEKIVSVEFTDPFETQFASYETRNGMYYVDGKSYKNKILVVESEGMNNGEAVYKKMYTVLSNYDVGSEEYIGAVEIDPDKFLDGEIVVETKLFNEPFSGFSYWPTKNKIITAAFDEKKHPETDIAGELYEPVYAVSAGTVINIGFDSEYGNFVDIMSGNARIRYSHLDSICVEDFTEVRAGDFIGEMGNTGKSTGPHLGLSLSISGLPTDIMNYYVEDMPDGEIRTKRALVDIYNTFGIDDSKLLYADNKKIIFSNLYGLFVYSKENECVEKSLDLSYIGCDKMQGEDCSELFVSKDSTNVYLHPSGKDYMFVYNTENNSLIKEKYNLNGIELHELPAGTIDSLPEPNNYDVYKKNGKDIITYLIKGKTISELNYADIDYESSPATDITETKLHPLML